MSHQLKKSEGRLENIRKVKPILAALRTISLGSWHMARSRRRNLEPYTQRLRDLLPILLPHVTAPGAALRHRAASAKEPVAEALENAVVLVIGSERGLCGRYNKELLAWLRAYVEAAPLGVTLTYAALGSRMIRELTTADYPLGLSRPLSITSLPSYQLAHDLTIGWLQQYEAGEIDSVDVIYNADQGAGTYRPATARLLPPEPPQGAKEATLSTTDEQEAWAREQIIIETDPMSLYIQVVQQLAGIGLYNLLLEAAVTEHSARYQLMESATQNADELVEQLMLEVQSARRQAITREMQELAVAAGLLGSSS